MEQIKELENEVGRLSNELKDIKVVLRAVNYILRDLTELQRLQGTELDVVIVQVGKLMKHDCELLYNSMAEHKEVY